MNGSGSGISYLSIISAAFFSSGIVVMLMIRQPDWMVCSRIERKMEGENIMK